MLNKRLGLVILISAFAVLLMAAEQDKPSTNDTQHAQSCCSPPVTINNNVYPAHNQAKSGEKPQGWHKFVAWPEGITVWALLATLIVVGLQTRQIRRAAEATRDAAQASLKQADIAYKALISQFRPKIQIRTIRLIETDDTFSIEVIVVNKGDTLGNIVGGSVDIGWQWEHAGDDTHQSTTTYAPFSLLPGEDAPLKTDMKDGWVLYRMAVSYADEGRPRAMTIRCSGELQYVDGIGTKRRTAFWRVLDHTTKRFIPDPTPEREYCD